jgi:hypothetical protein
MFYIYRFLGAFTYSRKDPISFVTSVRMYRLGSCWTDFSEIYTVPKICRGNPNLDEIGQKYWVLNMKI